MSAMVSALPLLRLAEKQCQLARRDAPPQQTMRGSPDTVQYAVRAHRRDRGADSELCSVTSVNVNHLRLTLPSVSYGVPVFVIVKCYNT